MHVDIEREHVGDRCQQNCNQTLRLVTEFAILSLVSCAKYRILSELNARVRQDINILADRNCKAAFHGIPARYFINRLRVYRDYSILNFAFKFVAFIYPIFSIRFCYRVPVLCAIQ